MQCVFSIEKQKNLLFGYKLYSAVTTCIDYQYPFSQPDNNQKPKMSNLEKSHSNIQGVFSIDRYFIGFGFHSSKDGNCQAYNETIYMCYFILPVICQKKMLASDDKASKYSLKRPLRSDSVSSQQLKKTNLISIRISNLQRIIALSP